jgi:aspartate/glutamate racemase
MPQSPRIFVIHALGASLAPVEEAFTEAWPESRVCNLMDDSLSVDRAAALDGEEQFTARFIALTRYCIDNGADGILFACSAFNAAIDACKQSTELPVLKPDEAMIEAALARAGRLAVLATFAPSIGSLQTQIQRFAAANGASVEVEGVFVDGALDALKAGKVDDHDARIAKAAAHIQGAGAILLAQFSMARAAPAVRAVAEAAVLTSPASAVAKLKTLV